jgi:hypothetical protein
MFCFVNYSAFETVLMANMIKNTAEKVTKNPSKIFSVIYDYFLDYIKNISTLILGVLSIWIGASLILNLPTWVPLDIGQNSSEKVLVVIKRQIKNDEQILKTYRKKTDFFDRIILFTEPKNTVDPNSDEYFKQKYRIYVFQNEERNSLQDFFKLDNWKKMSEFEFPLNSKNKAFFDLESKSKEDLNFKSIDQCKDLKPLNSKYYVTDIENNGLFCELKNSSAMSLFLVCSSPYTQWLGANSVIDYGIIGCSILQMYYQDNFLVKPELYSGRADIVLSDLEQQLYCESIFDGCDLPNHFINDIFYLELKDEKFKNKLINNFKNYSPNTAFINKAEIFINSKAEMLLLLQIKNQTNENKKTPYLIFRQSEDLVSIVNLPNFVRYCINYKNTLIGSNEQLIINSKLSSEDLNSCDNLIKTFYDEGVDGIYDFPN